MEANLGRKQVECEGYAGAYYSISTPLSSQDGGSNCAGSENSGLVSIVTFTRSGHKIVKKRYIEDIEMENEKSKPCTPELVKEKAIGPAPISCRRVLNFNSAPDSTGIDVVDACAKRGENDNNECSEEEGQHKKKWLEEQRKLFRGRVVSFIARMRLAQGGRQFSQRKGSVVDSVVGAFLTQNASDKHSSSAFMSLAQRYPHKDNNKNYVGPSTVQAVDALDWTTVRRGKVGEISEAIKVRGMNRRLAGRIQNFLNLLAEKDGSIALERLRDDLNEAKRYLLGIEGLGMKSVECIRLLTLHQPAFPVDTNVGRIVIRLGWVPLQPLPEGLQIHLRKQYPSMNSIQEYLWSMLCNLDHKTLYELHFQMITLGKVFCTKIKPNCKSCPMKGNCKHYASEFTSSSLALPQPEEKSKNWRPIAGVPPSKCTEIIERDIEDFLIEDETCKALVGLTSEAASIPLRKLKNGSRFRTEHQVYELQDSHSLLKRLDKKEPGDTCSYLLAIWTAEGRDSNTLGEFCNVKQCLSGSKKRKKQKVPGTLLIPCRTALKGNFPLNGTHFQLNEVFADDESTQRPISVPMALIRDLPRKTLYCGTSLTTICKGLSAEEINHCFLRGVFQ